MTFFGERFTLITDEWSNYSHRRYENFFIHVPNGMIWNLGLVRITFYFTAEIAFKMLSEILKQQKVL